MHKTLTVAACIGGTVAQHVNIIGQQQQICRFHRVFTILLIGSQLSIPTFVSVVG